VIFSSLIFIYLFLPLTLAAYYLINPAYKNYLLLLASLVFFAWGGVSFTIILLLSIILNYFAGLKIQKHQNTINGYRWLFAGITLNLLILGIFKYANFIISNLNELAGFATVHRIPQTHILLPIGISFYTFHSLSYLIDIYRGKTIAQRNIFDLSLYISMFSQLIAGPIIRYSDVWQQLRNRSHSWIKFSSGIEKFTIGLSKKVLLANSFGKVADEVFGENINALGAVNAWMGIVCYSFQIYCDFSGYSDMAIGLGRMFGFEFFENFNYPYLARSIKEFWRRWHISLSSFFRDYVYIPLGGNKIKISRTYLNLLIVFFLTGFWHGASWTFVAWGLFHGFFMIIERLGLEKILATTWKPIAIIYTLLVVMFAWVLFRADTLAIALAYWKALFNFYTSNEQKALFMSFWTTDMYLVFSIAILGAFGFFKWLNKQLNTVLLSAKSTLGLPYFYHVGSALLYCMLIIICSMFLISGSYNPFIYYRF
jgi:alginate O-acetyltransferase complex protein AlgI